MYNTLLQGRFATSIYDRDAFSFKTLKKSNEVYKWIKKRNQLTLSAEDENFIKDFKNGE